MAAKKRRILVTGVARWWGALLVQRLVEDPSVAEVIGIDTREPRYDLGRADYLKLDIRHSLVNGFYQGWDLHPAQLPTRYGTVYGFFLDGFAPASERLRNFVDKAAQATLVGDVFDDAATGQGLLNYFLRGIACGAVTEQEALATGLSLDEIRSKSFVKIMAARRARA